MALHAAEWAAILNGLSEMTSPTKISKTKIEAAAQFALSKSVYADELIAAVVACLKARTCPGYHTTRHRYHIQRPPRHMIAPLC